MKTDITFLLDRSGSMGGLKHETISGFNGLINEQRQVDGECRVTLHQFDYEFLTTFEDVDLREVLELDGNSYIPRGTTALLDSMHRALAATQERISKSNPDKVLFVVITDGHENASREVKKAELAQKIKELQGCKECGCSKWEFIFAGANIDSFSEAGSLGIAADTTMNYQATSIGTQSMYSAVSRGLANSRQGGQATLNNLDQFKIPNPDDPALD